MTWDDMKLARDGWLNYGRADQPKWPYVRPIYDRLERAPNGDMYCTFPDGSTVVYGKLGAPELHGPVELLYDAAETPE